MSLYKAAVLVALACLVPGFAAAQFVPCPYVPVPYLAIAPLHPTSAQPLAVTVAEYNFLPMAIARSVSGNIVDVTLSGHYNPSPVAIVTACGTVSVGPLPPGTYTVRFLLALADPPTLRATAVVDVGPDASAIPVLSSPSLLFVASLVVGALGIWSISRRCGALTSRSTRTRLRRAC